jgi:hypothetical protein
MRGAKSCPECGYEMAEGATERALAAAREVAGVERDPLLERAEKLARTQARQRIQGSHSR